MLYLPGVLLCFLSCRKVNSDLVTGSKLTFLYPVMMISTSLPTNQYSGTSTHLKKRSGIAFFHHALDKLSRSLQSLPAVVQSRACMLAVGLPQEKWTGVQEHMFE